MRHFWATSAVIVVAILIAVVGYVAKERRFSRQWVVGLAVFCGVALLLQLVTDWPFPTHFWKNHSVVASVLSSVLLLGVGFLVYEDRELREQERLDQSVTAAAVGGIVDKLVHIDVALGLLCRDRNPTAWGWDEYTDRGRPLRWLRQHPERLLQRPNNPPDADPRTWPTALPPVDEADPGWRQDVVDQCIRRLLTAIRDWGAVINTSRNGTRVLIAIGELRKDLMELSTLLPNEHRDALLLLTSLRQRVRLLSAFLEAFSGAQDPRPEILLTFDPVPPHGELEWAADTTGRDLFLGEWRKQLSSTERRLRENTVSGP
jgi:hypothetical protein